MFRDNLTKLISKMFMVNKNNNRWVIDDTKKAIDHKFSLVQLYVRVG